MKTALKVLGVLVAVVVVSGVVGLGVASSQAEARLAKTYESHRIQIPVPYPLDDAELQALRTERSATAPAEGAPADPLEGVDLNAIALQRAIARGDHLVNARYSCTACHGQNFGGGTMIDDPAIGLLKGMNITSGKGGKVATYDISDWDRIVRHGIKPDGHPAVMPSEDFFKMSDHELSDIVAYIRSQPAVDSEVPAPVFGPVGKVLLATGTFPVSAERLADHSAAHVLLPPDQDNTLAFGAHLTAICTSCHGETLAGGPMPFGPPSWPAASNLTQHETGLKGWAYEDFEKCLTGGPKKDGTALREPMTLMVPYVQKMTVPERKAIWAYLSSLPATPTPK